MSTISENLQQIRRDLPEQTTLVAVSKYYPVEAIEEAYAAGQRVFGESRVQELREKAERLPKDIQWHFIGHLQPNKVKYIAPWVSLIHAVDTPKLLAEINRQGERCQRVIPCLLQLHVAAEETKYGFTPEECLQLLQDGQWRSMPYVKISGVMCMATNTDDDDRIRQDFKTAHCFFKQVKEQYFAQDEAFKICSWGMSDDYPLALEEGSTHIRIGTKIFATS
jgi:pyridoxal phosphate enzyme (YggS family)